MRAQRTIIGRRTIEKGIGVTKDMNKVILIFSLLFLTGCQTTFDKVGYVKKDKLIEQIEQVKADNLKALAEKEREIKNALESVIEGKNAQLQSAANSVWAADNAFRFYKAPERLDIIINNRVTEALAALGLGPTLEAVQLENTRLTKELDEKLTSLEDLRNTNEEIKKENTELVIETESQLARVAELEKEKEKIKQDGIDKLLLKQDELNRLNDKIINAEKQSSEDKKYIEKNKRLIMGTLGLLSIAALFIAIYIPVYRKESGYFAAITGGVAIAIPFLQSWHVNIALLIGLAYIAYLIIRKQVISHKTNENLVNFVQDVKESKPDLYKNELKPLLGEWNTKYLKDGSKVEDKKITEHIEEILKDYERK